MEQVRSHERIDYKRCPKKWYWHWRKGLVPIGIRFGALELGTWVHEALAQWYECGTSQSLPGLLNAVSGRSILAAKAANAPEYVMDDAWKMAAMGEAMLTHYQKVHGADNKVRVLAVEAPLEFNFVYPHGTVIHKLKPDLVYVDEQGDIWLMEHKTAAVIRTDHLVIDDQARPYMAMAERGLKKAGIIKADQYLKGIMYNFIRKALPDERETDEQGRSLNNDGTVSKRQPIPILRRVPLVLTTQATNIALKRLKNEVYVINRLTRAIRNGDIDPHIIAKTPHSSCVKFCPYFAMCVTEEQGGNISHMQQTMYRCQDPYDYADTAEVLTSFEIG
jgi:hypothetical protein